MVGDQLQSEGWRMAYKYDLTILGVAVAVQPASQASFDSSVSVSFECLNVLGSFTEVESGMCSLQNFLLLR